MRIHAIRAWLTRGTEASSPHPVFASSSGYGGWYCFSCHRRRTGFRPPSGTAGIGDEGRLVLDTAIGVAVAEFRCAERVECFGVGRGLGQAERLDALRDRVFIRRSR